MSGALYQLYNPAPGTGWKELPGTMHPGASAPSPVRLVRAYGYLQVYNLTDGLPAPAQVVLSGLWTAPDEQRLSAWLDWWSWFVVGCTQYRRGERPADPVRGGSLEYTHLTRSNEATVTINLTPSTVRDPTVAPSGAIKGF